MEYELPYEQRRHSVVLGETVDAEKLCAMQLVINSSTQSSFLGRHCLVVVFFYLIFRVKSSIAK